MSDSIPTGSTQTNSKQPAYKAGDSELCPCGSGIRFNQCCEPVIQGARASSPEVLMRSRYSAYVKGCWSYLHRSWHPDTRPASISPTTTRWLGLNIIHADQSTVAFIARFTEGSSTMSLHETSRFAQVDGLWRYVDGECEVYEES